MMSLIDNSTDNDNNNSDPYKELEQYLEQVKNEISQVFDSGTLEFQEPPSCDQPSNLVQNGGERTPITLDNDLDPFLVQFNMTMESDLLELLGRHDATTLKDENITAKQEEEDDEFDGSASISYWENESVTTNILNATSLESLVSSLILNGDNNNTTVQINTTATQTSPTLSSQSSTNLSWASEGGSSSPCLSSSTTSSTTSCESDDRYEDYRSISISPQNNDDQDNNLYNSKFEMGRRENSVGDSGGGRQVIWCVGTKSSSTPVLKKGTLIKVNKQARSQSDRHLAEIEAAEACKWLRATGFPQYAQIYEDMQFPIDLSTVAQDHPLIDTEDLHSLFRRLQILNSCAHLHQQQRVIQQQSTNTDESEDEHCALSDNWTYQIDIKRWSRTCRNNPPVPVATAASSSSSSSAGNIGNLPSPLKCITGASESPRHNNDQPPESPRIRRNGSSKFRRRRDGVFIENDIKDVHNHSPSGKVLNRDNVPTSSPKALRHKLSSDDKHPASDGECTPKFRQRSRTKSFDVTDTWFNPQIEHHHERVLWQLPSSPSAHHHVVGADHHLGAGHSGVARNDGPSLFDMACTQLQVLRKLALLKLTAHMEKYCPSHRTGWNWDLPKFIRKMKGPAHKDKSVFGVPLTVILQKTGQPLPRNIEESLLWLSQTALDQVGLFRKSGVKSRIQALKSMVDTSPDILNLSSQQAYDVADMVKLYFRELPDTLLTNKMSETFILIFQYIPRFLISESVFCTILLMPNEHVQVLHSLLHFLLQISKHATVNQMTENNLALCFSPSLFHYSQFSSLRQNNTGTPNPKELAETRAGHECLSFLLRHFDTVFKVPPEFMGQCKSADLNESKAVKLSELGVNMGGWRQYLIECENALLRETRDRCRGWVVVPGHSSKVEISYKKVADGYPLRLWRVCTEIEASPSQVMHRIIRDRHMWDPDLYSAKIVSQIERNCEVFQFVRRNVVPLPNDEYCVLRTWRSDLPRDSCMIIETSIDYPDAMTVPHSVRGIVLASRYMIEPCAGGRTCKLQHLSRIDCMGKTPEWYQKNYGHICALFLINILNSFSSEGAKTRKV